MRKVIPMCRRLALFALVALVSVTANAQEKWKEGEQYFVIEPAQDVWMPAEGKITVTEVFSYGCPACNYFFPMAERLKDSLPDNAQLNYLPASFIPRESWPMFQRAWCTAVVLGVFSDATHKATFDAVWKSGKLATTEADGRRLKNPQPTIEDAAKFYAGVADVSEDKFLKTAGSFTTDSMMRKADNLVKAYRVSSTPTIVVAGKYRLTVQSAGGVDELIELVNYLVAKEAGM
ncbi:MAG: thiol:disulfide interchange protein DsbA/DsbL [Pseudomonadales bacterium]|nr:thiol:disulfide interchange protein DsbA/DsbL [Pseudomonadales bacterium]